ncbi:MAG: radical SAM family heme chaperone HemW [Kiritimatiellae bacterium]|nr:radical SAM family heme chaperone HemW [Kiritimatiellia bacterium]
MNAVEHLYIHIPFCLGKCVYCGFYSVTADTGTRVRYAASPARELRSFVESGMADVRPRTLYVGGGTPSLLGCDGLTALFSSIRNTVSLDRLEEATVEINPADTTPLLFQALRGLGVTRISLGAQSFSDDTLRRIGRRHNAQQIREAVRDARAAGFPDVGIDLIAGLPSVSMREWRETLDEAISLSLQHLSVYALSVEPESVLARSQERFSIPTDEAMLDALSEAENVLSESGFLRYEISNYALQGFECRHNLAVWRGEDYLGLGPAAASRVARFRWTNARDADTYLDRWGEAAATNFPTENREELSPVEDAIERVIFRFRLAEGIDWKRDLVANPLLQEIAPRWEKVLVSLVPHGIVRRTPTGFALTRRGREVCDAVLAELR